jgi:serine/threonine-protein kinase HipA
LQTLAPAYDLTFSSSGHDHHSTTIAGESKAPNSLHLMELARLFNVKDAIAIIDAVKSVLCQWPAYAFRVGVSQASTKAIGRIIDEMLKR